jgi:hypothetical protein
MMEALEEAMPIITFQESDSIQDISFQGISQFPQGYLVLLASTSKWFKTLNGAKKFSKKYGYAC